MGKANLLLGVWEIQVSVYGIHATKNNPILLRVQKIEYLAFLLFFFLLLSNNWPH